ncbi:hypothetical protein E4U21_007031 [Claviceps maximensis]|nr:hypothetical protein E4U21_007031 [Claviceps maximensis]
MNSYFFSLLLLSTLVAAVDIQSRAFNLILSSSSKEINGRALSVCYADQPVVSICLQGDAKTDFNFNVTEGAQPGPGGLVGKLTWTRPREPWIPFRMTFYINPASNVALPLLISGNGDHQAIAFDHENMLNIVSFMDDTRIPPGVAPPQVLKQWYICTVRYTSFTYLTLAWVMGRGDPQNVSCVKVSVTRSFVY